MSLFLAALSSAYGQAVPKFAFSHEPPELNGPVNPWRFLNAVGERGGVWGFENGRLEGWVYPIKIFHDFNLVFQSDDDPRMFPGEEIVRAVRVRPEMVQLRYAAERFSVLETLFTPRNQPGFVILLEVESAAPLRIYARFRPDLNLMWPAAAGGQTAGWDPKRKWLRITEPSGRLSALVGSPAAVSSSAVGYHAYLTGQHPHEVIELRVTQDEARRRLIPIITAAGVKGIDDPAATYGELLRNLPRLYEEHRRYFADMEASGTEFVSPDPEVNQALRWARVALEQLRVRNPRVGTSYVSGYGSSGTGTRPMYAWFFDEPAAASFASLAYGGAEGVKAAFRFIRKYQREDGKIPHEVSQSDGFIDWFRDYPFAYIHPDSSIWYILSLRHFYRFTGDLAFLRESWPSLKKAYAYSASLAGTSDGLPRIPRGEWGSIETAGFALDAGMSGLWIAALGAMEEMAEAAGERALMPGCAERRKRAAASLERILWNPELNYYNFGLDDSGRPVTYLNPMAGYSAFFGSLPPQRAQAVLHRLATAAFLSDWGQRNMSLEDPRYAEGSYSTGSVWPFLTAGPMLAHYRYHDAAQAYRTWMSMVRLRAFGARGFMPEALSGASYRILDNAVPHQMFSEMTVIPGYVQGVLGLDLNVPRRQLELAPHMPPAWPAASLRRLPYGSASLALRLEQAPGEFTARLDLTGGDPVTLRFAPALPAGSRILSVTQDGAPVPFHAEDNGSDVHALASVRLAGRSVLVVRYRHGVALDMDWEPLLEGESSRNLRLIESGFRDGAFEAVVEGLPDHPYHGRLFTPMRAQAAEGGRLLPRKGPAYDIHLAAPRGLMPDRAGYVRWTVRVRLD
ncbi:MAG: hypothetical protein LC126_15265 [Bryobacterales bacterium]|nr:hypothetical protein [Bryobacterales bacterium]